MKATHVKKLVVGIIAVGLTALAVALAQQPPPVQDSGTLDKEAASKAFQRPYSPYAGRQFPTQILFGDTHLHTMYSFDAGAFGCRLGPKDAYRFAKGDEVASSTGQRVRLARPLDFLVVSDHSDNMGFFPQLIAGNPTLLDDPHGRKWYNMIQSGKGADAAVEMIIAFSQGTFPKALISPRSPRVRVDCILPGPVLFPPDMPEPERAEAIRSTLVPREGKPSACHQQPGRELADHDAGCVGVGRRSRPMASMLAPATKAGTLRA
jgi:hypothetical protein